MDIATALLGFLTAVFGLVLTVVALWTKIRNGIAAVVMDVIVDAGLVKRGKKETVWPNGSDTLPDFLAHLYDDVLEIKRNGQQ